MGTLRAAAPAIYAAEGINGFYKSLVPLWGRQIPYTMMKFACFEKTVEFLYANVVPNPADTIVSYMNKAQGATLGSSARDLGFAGLWAGLGPRIIMIGTLTALQWFIYDGVKVQLRLPRPPPPEMPESLKKKLAAAQS